MPVKETAEYFHYGLMLGLHSVRDAMAWIDTIIDAEPVPDIALIEASLSGSRGPRAVADWLAQVPGEFDKQKVAKLLMRAMLERLNQDPEQAQRIARWLYEMALEAPDEAENEMWYFDDALELASDGIYGDVNEIRNELVTFLARTSADAC
jgi:hypothetical protein